MEERPTRAARRPDVPCAEQILDVVDADLVVDVEGDLQLVRPRGAGSRSCRTDAVPAADPDEGSGGERHREQSDGARAVVSTRGRASRTGHAIAPRTYAVPTIASISCGSFGAPFEST